MRIREREEGAIELPSALLERTDTGVTGSVEPACRLAGARASKRARRAQDRLLRSAAGAGDDADVEDRDRSSVHPQGRHPNVRHPGPHRFRKAAFPRWLRATPT